jgi:hypothetical protein
MGPIKNIELAFFGTDRNNHEEGVKNEVHLSKGKTDPPMAMMLPKVYLLKRDKNWRNKNIIRYDKCTNLMAKLTRSQNQRSFQKTRGLFPKLSG